MGKEEEKPKSAIRRISALAWQKCGPAVWREFPVMLENQQKCLSIISVGNSSFARFSHDRKGRKEAYFCLDFLVLLYQDKRT